MIKINCDLCGKAEENLVRAAIENAELNVCPDCTKFGKILAPLKRQAYTDNPKNNAAKPEEKEEKVKLLSEDYSESIKKARQAMGLSQKDFAARINEKESVIHKLETGALEPPFSLAEKLEKILGIKIIEEHHENHQPFRKKRDEGFTLGDFIMKSLKK